MNYMNSRKFSRSYPDATRKSWHCSGFTGKKKVMGLCAGDTFKTYYRQATVSSWGSVTCDKGDISIGGGCEAVASPFQVRYSGPTYAQKPAFGAAVKVESSFGGWSCGGFGGQKKVWVSCWKPSVVNCRVSAWSKWSKCSKHVARAWYVVHGQSSCSPLTTEKLVQAWKQHKFAMFFRALSTAKCPYGPTSGVPALCHAEL